MTILQRFQVAGHIAADWATGNPVLLDREWAVERDTGKVKLGDGVTAWNSLAYFGPSSASPTTTLQATEAISAGRLVNIYTVSGAARIRNASATDITKPAHGFALAAIASGASGAIGFPGQIITGLSTLVGGTAYFLDVAPNIGGVTPVVPSGSGNGVQSVGIALSASMLAFNPLMMIEV